MVAATVERNQNFNQNAAQPGRKYPHPLVCLFVCLARAQQSTAQQSTAHSRAQQSTADVPILDGAIVDSETCCTSRNSDNLLQRCDEPYSTHEMCVSQISGYLTSYHMKCDVLNS
jgi:hypothetical protein